MVSLILSQNSNSSWVFSFHFFSTNLESLFPVLKVLLIVFSNCKIASGFYSHLTICLYPQKSKN